MQQKKEGLCINHFYFCSFWYSSIKFSLRKKKPTQNTQHKKALLADILSYTWVLVSIFIFKLQAFGVYWEFISWGQSQQIHL